MDVFSEWFQTLMLMVGLAAWAPQDAPPDAPAAAVEQDAGDRADFAAFVPAGAWAMVTIEPARVKRDVRKYVRQAALLIQGPGDDGEENPADEMLRQAQESLDELHGQASEWLGWTREEISAYADRIKRVHVAGHGLSGTMIVGAVAAIEGPDEAAHRRLLAALEAMTVRENTLPEDAPKALPSAPTWRWLALREGDVEIHVMAGQSPSGCGGMFGLGGAVPMVAFIVRGDMLLMANSLDLARQVARECGGGKKGEAESAAVRAARPARTLADTFALHRVPSPATMDAPPIIWWYLDGYQAMPYARMLSAAAADEDFGAGPDLFAWLDAYYGIASWGPVTVGFDEGGFRIRTAYSRPTAWRARAKAVDGAKHVPFIPAEEEVVLAANWAGADLAGLLNDWRGYDRLFRALAGRADEAPAVGRDWPLATAFVEFLLSPEPPPPPVLDDDDAGDDDDDDDDDEEEDYEAPDWPGFGAPWVDTPAWLAEAAPALTDTLVEAGLVVQAAATRRDHGLAAGTAFVLRFKDADAANAALAACMRALGMDEDGTFGTVLDQMKGTYAATLFALRGMPAEGAWDIVRRGDTLIVGLASKGETPEARAVGPARWLAEKLDGASRLSADATGGLWIDTDALYARHPLVREVLDDDLEIEHLQRRPVLWTWTGDGEGVEWRLRTTDLNEIVSNAIPAAAAYFAVEDRTDRFHDEVTRRLAAVREAALRFAEAEGRAPATLDALAAWSDTAPSAWTNPGTGAPLAYRPEGAQADADEKEIVAYTPRIDMDVLLGKAPGDYWTAHRRNGESSVLSRAELTKILFPEPKDPQAGPETPTPDVF